MAYDALRLPRFVCIVVEIGDLMARLVTVPVETLGEEGIELADEAVAASMSPWGLWGTYQV